MSQTISLLGATYSDVPAVLLPKSPSGTARFTDTSVTTAVESDVASGKIFIKADGSQATGTASGGGSNVPEFTISSDFTTITCDKTYAQCFALLNQSPMVNAATVNMEFYSTTYGASGVQTPTGITYCVGEQLPMFEVFYANDGTITMSQTSSLIQLSATANGTYTPPSGKAYSSVDVAVQPTLVKYGIRPDATLVQTYTYDKWMHADESITIPSYSTSAQTIKASEALDTITLDRDNYYYRVVERMLTIPTYSVTTHNKGRCEYHIGAHVYEVIDIPASSLHSLIEPTRYYTSRLNTITTTMASYREVYYSAQTTLSTYSTQAYGVCQAAVAPTMSSGKLTINSPTVTCRGSTTYFVNTYANAVTDVRAQYIIEVYKVPKNNLNIEAWANDQLMKQIIESVNSNTQKLT